MVRYLGVDYCEAHRDVFDRIGVPCEIADAPDRYDPSDLVPGPFARCWFEPHTARDYLLMHIFLHELGHHHDRRTLPRGARAGRGEDFAEGWAIDRERALWSRYRAAFGNRARTGEATLDALEEALRSRRATLAR